MKWLDTNKGDPTNVNYRSRLAVREIKFPESKEEQLSANVLFFFSNMQPLKP